MDLHDAIERGDVDLAEELLKDPDYQVNDPSFLGDVPLSRCCYEADDNDVDKCHAIIKIMQFIIQHPKCNINEED